jgi:3-isopropylmalate dehydrogenase
MKAVITVLPGDGIGPDVVAEGVRVLQAVAERWGHQFVMREAMLGGCAIDATGTALPDSTLALCLESDAVLLGAVGGPKWDGHDAKVRPEQGLLGLRKALGLFANLRPVKVHPALVGASSLRPEFLQGVDLLVVRELTGGIYFGEKSRVRLESGEEQASDVCVYSTSEIERVVRAAATLARSRRKRLTSVDKANVLETSRLWRQVTEHVMRDEFPDIYLEHILVDACAMHLIRRPSSFDVIVTENMFGDILTDEASMLAGSIGMLPSASIGAQDDGGRGGMRIGLYEPIHGSAPDIAGKGLANPLGTILSAALLLRYSLGLEVEARSVEAAVGSILDEGYVTADIAPPGAKAYSTSQVGQSVAERVTLSGNC